MKTLKCVAVLFAFWGLMQVGCSDKSQSPVSPIDQSIQDQSSLEKCIITHFTESHYPVPPVILDPGVVKLVRRKWIMKNVVIAETLITTNSLVTGKMIHSLSAIMDKNTGEGPVSLVTGKMIHSLSAIMDKNTGEGPVWGTYTLTNIGNGVWKGTYAGWRSKKPGSDTLFTLPLKVLGHGKSGNVQGMKSFLNDVITAWGTPPVGWYGGGEGYIKSH